MSHSYECGICHTIQETPNSLCRPQATESECQDPTDIRHNLTAMCNPVANHIAYYCEGCGRPTAEPESVCMPTQIR